MDNNQDFKKMSEEARWFLNRPSLLAERGFLIE
jgi:hypothetical protein